jgi:hypothetical protein
MSVLPGAKGEWQRHRIIRWIYRQESGENAMRAERSVNPVTPLGAEGTGFVRIAPKFLAHPVSSLVDPG